MSNSMLPISAKSKKFLKLLPVWGDRRRGMETAIAGPCAGSVGYARNCINSLPGGRAAARDSGPLSGHQVLLVTCMAGDLRVAEPPVDRVAGLPGGQLVVMVRGELSAARPTGDHRQDLVRITEIGHEA